MKIDLFAFLLLLGTLSECNLSPINDDNHQDQVQITSRVVNQPTSTVLLSTPSTKMSWIKTLKNITEISGRTFYLECQVQSAYPVAFNWYRYNNPLDKNRFLIDPSTGRSSLQIKNLKEAHAGFYTCEASNGFQTVSSTGFVRVQNPDIEPIDFTDDLLPPIEFSVASIDKSQGSIDRLQCEIYSGSICRSILASNYVSVSNLRQKEIEENFFDHMKLISEECRRLLLPMICLFIYPLCDQQRLHVRSVCRHSCHSFENHPCTREVSSGQRSAALNPSFGSAHSIPTCQNLPPASDDPSCVPIELRRNVSSSAAVTNSSATERLFFSDPALIVLLSIALPIVIICLFLLFFYCCCHHRTKGSHSSTFTRTKQASHLSSPLHSIHSRTTHQAILSSSSSSTNTRVTNVSVRQTLLNKTSSHLPMEKNILCEISAEKIRFLQEIGEGEFGRIYLGEFIDTNERCLVKTLQTEKGTEDYLQEIEIFRHLHHTNISCLVGICIQSHETFSFLIYEYLNCGDLHEYLTQHSDMIGLRDFLHLAIQIVSGMIYLSERNLHHHDLALRNVLISEYRTIKITNIARYRREYHLDYYKIANRLLPVRWMSLESLLSGIYSEMSDVWSFGVLLWEMFSYGVQPYYGYTNPEVIEMIRDRKLLMCPMNCPRRIYVLMCSCWEECSEQRLNFVTLMERLKQWEERALTCLLSSDGSTSINRVDSPTGRSATPSVFLDRAHIRFQS